ncbi:MAG: diaminopimelate epimerase [Elusimicrobia bacterium]|nr:diaminopimelate epimerase [Elusimicrobiota bacterium]
MRFWKLTAAGNDFVLVASAVRAPGALARRLCDRRGGVGADGLLLVRRAAGGVDLRYFNADGSAAFCGNGTRCAAWWAFSRGWAGRRMRLRTRAGAVAARVTGRGLVALSMPGPKGLRLGLTLRVKGRSLRAHAVNMGVPHAVVPVRGLEGFPVVDFGRAIRRHPAFGRGGANVDFISRRGPALRMRTYERGVEGETWACGTGAAAAAVVAWRLGWVRPPVKVLVRGGQALAVSFRTQDGAVRDVRLSGPVRIVFEGEVRP